MRILAINDISCVGKCSLTVALPIISAAGYTCDILPTAILSTHTGGFTGYTFRDLSEDIPSVLNHWKSLGLEYDIIISGYLGSVEQVEMVEVLYAAPPQYHIRGAAINVVLRRRFGRSFSGQVNGTYEGGYYHSWGPGASAVYSTPTLSVDALYRVGEARSMRKLPLTSQHTVGSDTFDIRQEQRLADDNLTHNLRTGRSWKTSE